MGELSIRRNRELASARYQRTDKAEKQAATGQVRRTAGANRAAATVSETLRQLMTRVTQTERQYREGRRTLQSGEAALAEVEDNLGRMEELARQAAEDGGLDRAALQAELEQLRGEIERIAQNGVEAGLFQDGEAGEGLDALVDAVMDGLSAKQEGVQSLPAWLLLGMDNAPDKAALLAALGGSGDGLLGLLDGTSTPEGVPDAAPPMETLEFGTVQVSGSDLSTVASDPKAGVLTAAGTEHIILRGLGQQGQETPQLQLTGSGSVTLQQISSPLLSVESAQARVFSTGENTLARIQLSGGVTLTVDGGGLLRVGSLRGGPSSVLRLTGGAVILTGEASGASAASVVVDGPVSLLAAEGIAVRNAQGEPLRPFDIVWKTLLPKWSSLTSLAVDGRQGQLILREDQMDPVRLWLLKQDSDGKWPAHTIVLRGRDKAGHPRTQYLYVRWDENTGRFQETSMHPNPFTVTGGEPNVDWRYEEETCTLHILSREVTAIAGGTGTDGNQLPFSGRISLADGIGAVKLTLDGVECRVSTGRAFNLGRGNDVTLLLQRGTDNIFESGTGFAGISLREGTSLCIDQAKGAKGIPDGTLTATGGAGGAGIGRDSSAGRERTGPILIRGGVITSTGIGGGAGIGGALGAPAGDIRIQGGTVTAQAACCAAAIGAGIQGACGDIIITGSARVIKAQGGGPDGDIGGCLFGNCGKVQVSAGTDIGQAKLWAEKGLSLQMGEDTVTLPRFRVSARALRLDALALTTREAAQAAMTVLAADRRWVTRLQGAYGAMYGQLGQSFSSMYSFHSYTSIIRDSSAADTLSCDIREVLRQSPLARFLTQRGMEDVGQLLR